jgi:uncharacterized protein (TIGR02453 family)
MATLPDDLFEFLADLADNNERAWFKANQDRYEASVREPCLQFIRDFESPLKAISSHYVAEAKKVGGSMFRIFRDVRFSKDKSPYKTHTGIQFRHERGTDAHAPGFYLHLEPNSVFVGVGVWHPDRDSLATIRAAIANDTAGWQAMKAKVLASGNLRLSGESLSRPPRGFDKDHPAIEDLRRKDFILVGDLSEDDVLGDDATYRVAERFSEAAPLVAWLCDALGLPF